MDSWKLDFAGPALATGELDATANQGRTLSLLDTRPSHSCNAHRRHCVSYEQAIAHFLSEKLAGGAANRHVWPVGDCDIGENRLAE
jgi:hypothetical protein